MNQVLSDTYKHARRVVIAIVGLVVGVAVSRFSGADATFLAAASARDITAGLRMARSEAIGKNEEVAFTIDVRNRWYRVASRKEVALPETLNLALYTAAAELVNADVGSIRFFSDGSSTGGRVRIGAANDTSALQIIAVDWLTGNVSVQE